MKEGITLLGEVGAGIIQAIPDIIAKIPEVIAGIVGAFKEYDWLAIGKDILTGIGEGIKSAVSGLVDAAKSAAGALVDGVKGMFKIGSPSKLMADEIGQWIPAGIAMGINENIGVIDSAMNNMNSALMGANVVGAAYTPGQIYRAGGAGSEDRSEREVNVQVVLEGDAQQLFRVVRKQNQKFAMATGKGAF